MVLGSPIIVPWFQLVTFNVIMVFTDLQRFYNHDKMPLLYSHILGYDEFKVLEVKAGFTRLA